jgi:pSer/pThr/pTyr-binding forkhead associated (FHA) protein
MTLVTLRVLDGADRGRAFDDIPTPFTVGREEGNSVQLNDERVSRFHVKIQEDDGKLVLADLESTNGTKINGETVQLCLIRPGDLIALGRSILVVGSRHEIADRVRKLRGEDLSEGVLVDDEDLCAPEHPAAVEFAQMFEDSVNAVAMLHTILPPELPKSLDPGQAAQLVELLRYFHFRLRGLVESVKPEKVDRLTIDHLQWQNLIDLHSRTAEYLREIGEPQE